MGSSELANRPRGPRAGGFFEIWFLVVFAPRGGRAWWLRYTTFVPVRGSGGAPRATLWAAAFDAAAAAPAIAIKDVRPLAAYSAGDGFAVRIGDAVLTDGTARGGVAAGGHAIAWDLRFTPAARSARRAPWIVEHLPLPTRVAHANAEIRADGSVVVDGARHELAGAPAVQKHIWGTRRVEELFWLYCACFDGAEGACIEATAVRPSRRLPGGPLTTLWLRTADGDVDATGLAAVRRNRVAVTGTRLEFWGASRTAAVHAVVSCEPRMLAAWVYRDPRGWDVHVAQSDVASCTVEVRARGEVRRLVSTCGAAVELHAPEPLPGVRYVAWDATA